MKAKITLLFVLAAAVLAGCATTKNLEERKQEKYAAYSELPAEQRALVDQGKIAVGMSTDAVYVAWGPASTMVSTHTSEGPLVTWVYYGSYLQPYRYWDYHFYPGRRGYHFTSLPYLDTGYVPSGYVQAEVIFRNNVVLQWRTFGPPPY